MINENQHFDLEVTGCAKTTQEYIPLGLDVFGKSPPMASCIAWCGPENNSVPYSWYPGMLCIRFTTLYVYDSFRIVGEAQV